MKKEYRKYKTPEDFRRALDEKMRKISNSEGKTINEIMYKIAFDRFLARVFYKNNKNWVLKGGYSLELRFKDISNISRTTTDIDFALKAPSYTSEKQIWDLLQEIAKCDLTDWFNFTVGAPKKELTMPTYGGWRFPVTSRVGTREFNRFNVDISIAESFLSTPKWEKGNDFLSFAGIKPPKILIISAEKQFAEKIHAYTNPQIFNNSRTRDLIDLVIYIDHGFKSSTNLKKEISLTFKTRDTHDVPRVILEPPIDWKEPYKNLATNWGASKTNLQKAHEYLSNFWKRLYKIN